MRTLRVFSKHPSHNGLRKLQLRLPVLACIRFGSKTKGTLNYKVELNLPEYIDNSASKLLMKTCFTKAGVKTAPWYLYNKETKNYNRVIGVDDNNVPIVKKEELPFPLVAKSHFGSRGEGNYLLKSKEEFETFVKNNNPERYIFEKFLSGYNREYRIHVTEYGYFYTCRKMIKNDTPKEERWHRHEDNSTWIIEENPMFDKPANWDAIVKDCITALKATGLDFGAFDVKVQSAKDKKEKMRENPEWALLEINSAPSFGEGTLEKYSLEVPKMVQYKLNKTK